MSLMRLMRQKENKSDIFPDTFLSMWCRLSFTFSYSKRLIVYVYSCSAKKATKLFSGALTTIGHQIARDAGDNFVSVDYDIFSFNGNPSNAVGLSLIAELRRQIGSMQIPYLLNKIISFCAKSAAHDLGIQVHSLVTKMGFTSNPYICTALVDMYGKFGEMFSSQKPFDGMPKKKVVTWNSLISAYLHVRCPEIAVGLFIKMLKEGLEPTAFSVSAILVGCSQLEDEGIGAQVHSLSLKLGLCHNVVVETGLIDMYSKCCNVEDSKCVFDQMQEKNVITWTSMVTGYAQNEQPDEAMILFKEMLRLGLRSNKVAYNSLLSSFSSMKYLDCCKQIHCRVIREGFLSNVYMLVTLATVYSKCDCGLEDFQKAGNNIDYFTLTSMVGAIGVVSGLIEGKQMHAIISKTGYSSNVFVQNRLIFMYARCGAISDSKKVFSSMGEHDLISWNSLLSGCAHHGYGKEVVELFERMRRTGIKPDGITFLAVLSACSHAGFIDKGLEYFYLMNNDASLEAPRVEHYAAVVDLFGRAGYLKEAESFVNRMPMDPGTSVYKALLSACQVHGNREIAMRSAKRVLELWPNDPATYVLLSNVLKAAGCWDDAVGIHTLMFDRGMRKKPGYSWV
ncbi:putative Pentatricopeptide repeat-containing protein [Melia azedarach]|uniref:Pentatricopeptide repeat-containing protein n=1 Tax=Melia azedarach TaxID=155640 RepID=A0ACC1YQD2_MELAZ|nr:putative Pentatricopeptide repeat-containing protein [Melia azedarach]